MIVLSPRLKAPGTQDATAWSHMSYLATVEDLFSLQRLQTVAMTPTMSSLFQ